MSVQNESRNAVCAVLAIRVFLLSWSLGLANTLVCVMLPHLDSKSTELLIWPWISVTLYLNYGSGVSGPAVQY